MLLAQLAPLAATAGTPIPGNTESPHTKRPVVCVFDEYTFSSTYVCMYISMYISVYMLYVYYVYECIYVLVYM